MEHYRRFLILLSIAVIAFYMGGCYEPLSLETEFPQVTAGQSSVSEVLNLLPEDGMMHTASSISVFQEDKYRKILGIVRFNQETSTVERTHYLRSRFTKLFTPGYDQFNVVITGIVPADILDKPYDRQQDKYKAILRYFHDQLIEDAKPFLEDRQTESMTGLGRTMLGVGILALDEKPRHAERLTDGRGFKFTHPTLGPSQISLNTDDDSIYELTLSSKKFADVFTEF